MADLLVDEIESCRYQIAGFEEPLRTEFRNAATKWLELARHQFAGALTDTSQVTAQLFRAGDPVNREQEALVYRRSIVAEMEQQILLATGCPGLVLYGRRRMGKSTVLKNLTGFLPTKVPVDYLSMQNPLAFTTLGVFCQQIASAIRSATRWDDMLSIDCNNLLALMRLLSRYNERFAQDGRRLLLAIDEYEMIDTKIGEGVFTIDLLNTLRESIQSHRNLTWVLAGSHEIAELKHAEWSSYLVSARTVEVLPFTPVETRELLTNPMKHSKLWLDDAKRPRFELEFWGANGIERIHADTGGWPIWCNCSPKRRWTW